MPVNNSPTGRPWLLLLASIALLSSCELADLVLILDADGDGFPDHQDCDDHDHEVNPWGEDVPGDNIDQDCNGVDATLCFIDADRDGHGNMLHQQAVALSGICEGSGGLSERADDCNDNDASVHPGAAEQCDLLDNDCDEEIDEDLPEELLQSGYIDLDGDGDGDQNLPLTSGCGLPLVKTHTDCDDDNPAVAGTKTEICDGQDNNCDGLLLSDDELVDNDSDGSPDCSNHPSCPAPATWDWQLCGDCDDENDTVFPAAHELCTDSTDNDCDQQIDEVQDQDMDSFNNCQSNGQVIDCDDTNPQVNPAADESLDNCIDDNCDGEAPTQINCSGNNNNCVGDADPRITIVVSNTDWGEDLQQELLGEESNGYCSEVVEASSQNLAMTELFLDTELIIVGPDFSPDWLLLSSPDNAFNSLILNAHQRAELDLTPVAPSMITIGPTTTNLLNHLNSFIINFDWTQCGLAASAPLIQTVDAPIQCSSDSEDDCEGAPAGIDIVHSPNCPALSRVRSASETSHQPEWFFTTPNPLSENQNGFSQVIDENHPAAGRTYPVWEDAAGWEALDLQRIAELGCNNSDSCWTNCNELRALVSREKFPFSLNPSETPEIGSPWLYHWGYDASIEAWKTNGISLFKNLIYWSIGCPDNDPDCAN